MMDLFLPDIHALTGDPGFHWHDIPPYEVDEGCMPPSVREGHRHHGGQGEHSHADLPGSEYIHMSLHNVGVSA